jgi:hypothetical protein
VTEAEWLASTDPLPMLEHLEWEYQERKLRLFCTAACRAIWHLLPSPAQNLVAVTERFADGQATEPELATAKAAVGGVVGHGDDWDAGANAVLHAAERWPDAPLASRDVRFAASREAEGKYAWLNAASTATGAAHCDLLRHIFGNPFQPYPAPDSWPSAVVELAQSLYDGHGDRLVLADALEEAGHGELAGHFRSEEWHPKGCYGMDLVLGRE